ncbi:hypothetical protein GCM10027610_034540 [Dactylosporangium cerinum]
MTAQALELDTPEAEQGGAGGCRRTTLAGGTSHRNRATPTETATSASGSIARQPSWESSARSATGHSTAHSTAAQTAAHRCR